MAYICIYIMYIMYMVLQDCRANAGIKGVLLHRHRYPSRPLSILLLRLLLIVLLTVLLIILLLPPVDEDKRFWCSIGLLQFLYACNNLPRERVLDYII